MTAALLPPARAARLIHALFVIQLISMGAMEMSGPFWPVHLKTHSTSALEFGIASVAVYIGPMLGIMLTAAFWGRVGDRFGHKLMMVRALLGLSLTQLALAFATDVWMILALRCIQGACAGYIAPAQTYGVSVESPLRRARLFAYLQVSTNLGSLVGAVAGGLILDHATFFWINLIAAVLCAGCALMVALMLPDVRTVKPATSDAAAPARTSLWKSPPIPGLLAVIGLLLVSRTITQTPFSLYVDTVFRVGNWLVGLCYGLQALGFVVSASLWARHFEDKPLAEALRRITCVALACAALTLAAGLTRNVAVFIVIHDAWGVLLGATTPVLMSLVSRAAGAQRQGHTLGAAQSVTQVSSITGIALGGWLSQAAGLQYTYFFVAVAYALSVAGILAVRREDGIAARAEAPAGQS
jgi:MFS family permease